MVASRRHCCTVTRECLRGCVCIFAVGVVCTKQVSWVPVHASVYIPQGVLTSPYISATKSLQGVHITRVFAVCSFALGDEGGRVQMVYAEQLLLAWGFIFTEGEIEVTFVLCLSIFFCAGGGVRVCVCVCARTHTHCTLGARCESRGRTRHWESLKNPDGLNLGKYVFRLCIQCTHV